MYANIGKSGQKINPSNVVDTRMVSNAHTSEYMYYECQKINLQSQVINCEYEENRVTPIVLKPSDYKFSVQRIEASLIDVPMFNSDDKLLEMTYVFPPDNLSTNAIVLLPSGLDVYNINQVIPYLNSASSTAFLALQGLYNAIYGPGAWAANPLLAVAPFGFRYEETTDRLVIYSDTRNADGLPNATYLDFNSELQELFRGNTYMINPSNRVMFDEGYQNVNLVTISSVTYIANVASYSTSAMWYSVKQVVVISNKLTARAVQIGTPGVAGTAATRNIVLDFNYVPDNAANAPGTRLQYLSNNNRWTDLMGDNPISSIDFSLYYRNKDERLIPVKLRPGESFSILCVFAKTLTT